MKKAAIFFGGWDGHEPEQTTAIVKKLLETENFEVHTYNTLDLLEDKSQFEDFSLIIMNWTMGEISFPAIEGLRDLIASGIGLAGWHGGMGDAFRNNAEFQFIVGGQFVAHPDNIRDYTVNISNTQDPITQDLTDFPMHSEQYYMHTDPSNQVLATTTFSSIESHPWVNGTTIPVVWKRTYDKGKIFYSSLCHVAADFDVPQAKELLRRGMLWAAK
ncbi:Trehalose utilization [Poriferisphaera corsica]|uniref:Trehalose utilization n=1 Tax=Poriferisphaera corsica TaxID=2528020 RepID=A0A517YW76_9BACT|nr:ThuA domain-containing protein [Poriferisphaera corsica]QDU34466.1 Trehalose utilization [Poriferisphaera corsica]